MSRTNGPKVRAYVPPSTPSDAATSPTLVPTQTARPPSRGWAKARVGVRSRTPSRGQVEVTEGRGCQEQRVHRGAHVVPEAAQRQLRRPAAATGLVGGLEDLDGEPGACHGQGGHEAVGARTTTTASTLLMVVRSQGNREPFFRADHRYLALGESAQCPFHLGVDPIGPVVEQRHPSGARPPAQAHRVLRRGMSERRLSLHLLGAQMGVVDQQVDAAGQFEGGLVVLADPFRAGPERRRAVVGDVGDRGPAVS